MKILYIAPLPPPITGHSLVSQVLLDALASEHEMAVVDLSKDSFADGAATFERIDEVLGILRRVAAGRRGAERIYLTISESFLGNMKDLLIYLLCAGSLRRMYIHLHGGSIKRLLWDRRPWLRRVNAFFIRRLGGAIVSGRSHLPIFEGMLPADRVHIVPNFAQDYLFSTTEEVAAKFASAEPIRVLYMSNFIPAKGYLDLVEAYASLDAAIAARFRIDFAGKFDSADGEQRFLQRIAGSPALHYYGMVGGDAKRRLFADAHVFCLPTALFEGQPISILEAYASGCVVVTTGQAGILDIFADGVQGHQIEPSNPASIAAVLRGIASRPEEMREIGVRNNLTARSSYRTTSYTAGVSHLLLSGAGQARSLTPSP